MKSKRVVILSSIFALILLAVLILYGYSLEKGLVSVVLQYQIDLEDPPDIVYAIVTKPQKYSKDFNLSKGTRFFGKVQKFENGEFIIDFDTIQWTNGKKEKFTGRTVFDSKEGEQAIGISSKIGKTIYQKTKTSVLGAIFSASPVAQRVEGSILPRGTELNISVE